MDKREAIKELYKKAFKNADYAEFEVWENRRYYAGSASPPYPESCISYGDECEDIKESVRKEITGLGFSLEEITHVIAENGKTYDRNCYIKWQGQHFSREDLFLDGIKELAELLGYDVRSVSKPPYWGIYGDTLDDALANFEAFSDETGLRWKAAEAERQDSGYVYFAKSWYLNRMFALFAHFKSVDLYWKDDYLYADVSIIPNVEKCNGAYCYYYKIRVFSAGRKLTEGTIYLPTISTTLLIPSPPSEGSIVFKLVEIEKATESEEVVDEVEKTVPAKPTPTPTPTPTPPPGYLFYDTNEYRGISTAWRVITSTTIEKDAYVEIGGDVRQIYEDGYVAYLGYRKNRGAWIEIGRNNKATYITVHTRDTVRKGDIIEFGLRWGGIGGNARARNLYIKELPCELRVEFEGSEVTEVTQYTTVDIVYEAAPSDTTLKVISPSYEYVLRKTVSGSGSESFSADEVGTYFIYLQNEDCYVTKELKVRAPPTPTPTPTPTPAPTPTPKCPWFASRMPVKAEDIMDLVRAYLGIIDLGWVVSAADIMGAVAYYHGEMERGNNLTGCSL